VSGVESTVESFRDGPERTPRHTKAGGPFPVAG
jgi:hypothetical protein